MKYIDWDEFETRTGHVALALAVVHRPCQQQVWGSDRYSVNLGEIWTACEEHTCPET